MEESKGNFISNQYIETDTINIREELEKYIINWKWFLLAVLISLSGAFIYLRYSIPTYTAATSILIKDNQKSGISSELAAFEDLGIIGGGSSNNPENEIEILKSRKIIGKVVDELDLEVSYYTEGRVKKSEVYKNTPIVIDFVSKNPLYAVKDTSFIIAILGNKKIAFRTNEDELSSVSSFDALHESSFGIFKVLPNSGSGDDLKDTKVYVTIRKRNSVIDSYKNRIQINSTNKNSSVLNLSLTDVSKEKAEDILNELVEQYNTDAINDKNEVSEKTKDFIENRLQSVGVDLSSIQDDVKDYKTKFGITGLSTEGEMILEEISVNKAKIIELKNQLSLAAWIEEKLSKGTEDNEVLPTNVGFFDPIISESIGSYNELILRLNRFNEIAGSKNPELIDLQNQIKTVKSTLLSNISNVKTSFQLQLNQLNKQAAKVNSEISLIPAIERGMIDIERQKIIYAELFSYLLKKKEETAISLAVTVPNAKIIDYAYGNGVPVSPKKRIIYLAALMIGLIIPFIIIYVKNLLDTKIHTRKDIEELTTIPFLGDVPHSETDEKIVIGNDSRTSTAEAFRLIRTNLGFMLPNHDSDLGKTIFITSTTSGEGKSFISINLAAALSLSNKKVLLMGVDLRAPKVTEYLGIPERKGITNYITNESLTANDIKFSIPEIKGLDIISSGVIPPNPAELLLGDRIKQLFEQVKKEYDFIIVDTAPVNLVTDTFLVSKYADMTIYVSRANYIDKRMLNVAQNLYNEKKLQNMAIVLNDTDMTRGYGYGYGYGYTDVVKKPWYKKVF